MRLHRLHVEAFGPFAEPATVDFDSLTSNGLFLLTGPTGAGKSSVLDAVCFGLYGVVPGSRHAARQLRSDHADPAVEPQVTLEFSVAERRFQIRRSPAWHRPKRRGHGLTQQPARVVLEERVAEEWIGLSTRNDEVGDLVTGLLGMHPGQFTQVAMLPQGEFQQFLTARTDERQAILQRLFRTDRFEAVEGWLRDRRLSTARTSETHRVQVHTLLERLAEASGSATSLLDGSDDAGELSRAARSGSLVETSAHLSAETTEQLRSARALSDAATAAATGAQQAEEAARHVAALRERGTSAQQALSALDDTHDEAVSRRQRLEDHLRAQPALALGREHARASVRLAERRAASSRLLADLGLPSTSTSAEIQSRLESARRSLAAVEEFVPRQRALDEATQAQRECSTELDDTGAALERLEAARSNLPGRRAAVEEAIVQARLSHERLPSRQAAVVAAQSAEAAARELASVRQSLADRRGELTAATDAHQSRREHHLELREARIESMAGELAASLTAGCSCPVCGSASHPAPATWGSTFSREDEDAARAAVDDAAIALETVRDGVRSLEHRVSTLEGECEGLDATHWGARLRELQGDLASDRAEAERLPGLIEESESLATEALEEDQRVITTKERISSLDSRLTYLADKVTELIAARCRVLEGTGQATVEQALTSLRRRVTDLEALRDCLIEAEHAADEEARVAVAVLDEATDAGFADWPAVEAAAMEDAERAAIEAELLEREHRHAAATATLAEPQVIEALEAAPPDLAQLSRARADAVDARDAALAELSRLALTSRRLTGLHDELSAAVASWLPVLEALDAITAVADLAEGRGDQAIRMRLSAYVLSERLRAVVDAANDRLVRMGRDRFTLEQTDEASGRDRRGGLGLRVRDAWTSTQREVGTLSGGETFVVSLALALGLADTVTAESGGTRIETLFVDEGFGSLDTEALEGVLDTLDSLREGGRAVGVVSHVTEMRERIPTQLRVTSSPDRGSRLAISVG